jgi:hypothetical protein
MDDQGESAACRQVELEFKGLLLGGQGLRRANPIRLVSKKIEACFSYEVDASFMGEGCQKLGGVIPYSLRMDAESQEAAGKPLRKLPRFFMFTHIVRYRRASPVRPWERSRELGISRIKIRQVKVSVAEHLSILGKTYFPVNPEKR